MQLIEALRLVPQEAKFVRVNAEQGVAHVTAAIAEGQITIVCEADDKSGAYAVDGKVVRFARALAEDAKAVRKGDKLRITVGHASYSFATLEADSVPVIAEPEQWQRIGVDPRPLHDALAYVREAAALSDLRWYLMGVHLRVMRNAVDVVATDGHVAALASEGLSESAEASMIVPNKCIKEILPLLQDAKDGITVETGTRKESQTQDGHTLLRVRAGPVTYLAKGYDSQYPAYREIFERARPRSTVLFDADTAIEALKRLSFAVQSKLPALRLTVKGSTLTMASADNAQAEGTETIELREAADDFECGVNLYYLEPAVSAARGVAKDVTLGWRDHEQPLTVQPRGESAEKGEARKWIVMPCNL